MILVLVPVVFELIFVAAIFGILNQAADSFTKMHRSREATNLLHRNELSFSRMILFLSNMEAVQTSGFATAESLDKMISTMNTSKEWRGVDINQNPELKQSMEKGRELRENFLQLYEQGIGALQGGPKAVERWANRVGMLVKPVPMRIFALLLNRWLCEVLNCNFATLTGQLLKRVGLACGRMLKGSCFALCAMLLKRNASSV